MTGWLLLLLVEFGQVVWFVGAVREVERAYHEMPPGYFPVKSNVICALFVTRCMLWPLWRATDVVGLLPAGESGEMP